MSMTESSAAASEMARKLQAVLLRQIARTGQNRIADEIGVSPATMSRWVSEPEGLERACRIAATLGFKLVPSHVQVFPPEKIGMLMELARDHLNSLRRPEQLAYEYDEDAE